MTYEQTNAFAAMQRRQMTWMLIGFFMATVAAITFSAIIVSAVLRGSVANALSNQPQTAQLLPADYTAGSSCLGGSGGMGGGGSSSSMTPLNSASSGNTYGNITTGGMGGGGSWGGSGSGGMGGGSGSGGGGVSTTSYTYNKTITRNVDSNNTIGSNNGSNNTSTTTTTATSTYTDSFNQGSYNDVSKGGELKQVNVNLSKDSSSGSYASSDTSNTAITPVIKSGNSIDSGNDTTKNVDVTKVDSHNTSDVTNSNSNNTVDIKDNTVHV